MQTPSRFLIVSTVFFGLVAFAHAVRAMAGWPIVIGQVDVPLALSWIAACIAAALSLWARSLCKPRVS